MTKKTILTNLAVSIIFIILVTLGFWQLSRLKEKKLFLASMQTNLTSPAINLAEIQDDAPYSKVKITGYFLPDKDIYLYGRRSMSSEKDGYYLVTPFKTTDNKIILVARGWFSNRNKNIISGATNDLQHISENFRQDEFKGEPAKAVQKYVSTGELLSNSLGSSLMNYAVQHELIGVTMPSEKTRSYLPANDIKNNVWLTLDLQEASKVLELDLENFYLIEASKDISNLDILLPLSINHLAAIRNDHLEYALTWFGLAASLIVIYVIYRKKHNE